MAQVFVRKTVVLRIQNASDMNYAQVVFGKSLTELTYADIESYFQVEREESDQLEFKSYIDAGSLDSKVSGLVRSVAAFLNSDGGILIWGAPSAEKQQRGDRKVAVFKGALTQLPQEASDKDWIVGKISTNIVPLPSGIRVQVLRDTSHCIAVFEVDKSSYSPHQADERYYMRLDGQTRAAPHHYVEALFNRVSYPEIEAYIKPTELNVAEAGNGFWVKATLYFANQSMFPNEEGFNVKVTVFGGTFSDQKSFTIYNHPNFLYYGEWVPVPLTLFFPTHDLARWEYIGRIMVFFAGKTAPRKLCEYHVRFKDPDFRNPAANFSIITENKLQSELIAEKNASDENRLLALGVLRKPQS